MKIKVRDITGILEVVDVGCYLEYGSRDVLKQSMTYEED